MKRILTAAAIPLGLLTGTAAHAAPTCHQKVAMFGQEFFTPAYKLRGKVTKMVKSQRWT